MPSDVVQQEVDKTTYKTITKDFKTESMQPLGYQFTRNTGDRQIGCTSPRVYHQQNQEHRNSKGLMTWFLK